MHDRQAEIFEPLFAILSVLDKARVPEFRACVATLTSTKISAAENEELGLKLLSDIRDVWPSGFANTSSERLVEKLRGLEESPWSDFELSQRKLASKLRPFGIQTRQIRIGSSTAKGYLWAELESVFCRYLASNGVLSETSETARVNIGENDDFASET